LANQPLFVLSHNLSRKLLNHDEIHVEAILIASNFQDPVVKGTFCLVRTWFKHVLKQCGYTFKPRDADQT